MSDRLERLLQSRPYLLADGATGTNLFDMGLMTGDSPEMWNFEQPDRIAALHRSMIAAGADIILTNSFGGTRHRLKLHKAEDRVREVNETAARIARRVADEEGARLGREILVAGSMGPTGELFEPLHGQGEMGASFVIGDRMDFIEDDRFRRFEKFSAPRSGKENVQRFGSSNEYMRGPSHHGLPLVRRCIPGAHRRANLRHHNPFCIGQMENLGQRLGEVFGDIIGQGLEG